MRGPARGAWRAGPALTALGALLAAAACAPEPGGGAVVETTVLDGSPVALVAPEGAEPKALVVFLHGLHEDHESVLEESPLGDLVSGLVAGGYAVASSDADGDNFGNPESREDYLALARYAQDRLGTSATLLLAESMGGLAAIPLAASGDVSGLRGTAAINPAIPLTAPSGDGYLDAAVEAWGREPGPDDDPLALPPQEFAGQSFRLYVAAEDEIVPTAEHAGAFASRVGGLADVSLVACSGGHVDPSCFQPDDVVSWFDGLLTDAP
jgi:hypothetical protein